MKLNHIYRHEEVALLVLNENARKTLIQLVTDKPLGHHKGTIDILVDEIGSSWYPLKNAFFYTDNISDLQELGVIPDDVMASYLSDQTIQASIIAALVNEIIENADQYGLAGVSRDQLRTIANFYLQKNHEIFFK